MHQRCSGFILALLALLGGFLHFNIAFPIPAPFRVVLELIAVFSSLVSGPPFIRFGSFLRRLGSVTIRGWGVDTCMLPVIVASPWPSIFLTFRSLFPEASRRFEVGTCRRGRMTSLPSFMIKPCWSRLCIGTTSGEGAKRCVQS